MDFITAISLRTYFAIAGMVDVIAGEAKRLRSDQRGMELLQVLLIIVVVVILAGLVWTMLNTQIRALFERINTLLTGFAPEGG